MPTDPATPVMLPAPSGGPAPLTADVTVPATGVDDLPDGLQAGRRPRSAPGLSPSRANDFLQCPLLFRFRVIDRLPEPASAAAVRGTLVHAVLERVFDVPAGRRTLDHARGLLAGEWERMVREEPAVAEVLEDADDLTGWFDHAGALLETYYTLEDPNRLEPAERELTVRTELEDGLQLRGIVDRLDVAPDGALRVVDYKTGKSPRAGYEGGALFQMRFYALVLSRLRGRIPAMLQLVYLGDGTLLRHVPDAAEIETTEKRVRAIWAGIRSTAEQGSWRPRTSKLCGWCAHQSICPAFGGTPPPVPEGAVELSLGVRPLTARAGR
ncbi:RecB family exonuclease [Actinotalea sp. K2]|uniref:RecB family exonuclease n=1 Tax=Actinotalea sp. K2 TaxID=2939438 RepID=UPI002016DD30|nr:RecB family exonuclease [Actinotalea sp. K2]MCL3861895.1 RecB family exonuclease [Actinotalea sp. K2]